MTNHIQKNTLSGLDSPVFSVEDEWVEKTLHHRCEKGNEILFSDSRLCYRIGENEGEIVPGVCLFLQEMKEYTLFSGDSPTIVHRITLDPVFVDDLLYPYENTELPLLVLDRQVEQLVCQLYEELAGRKPYYEWICRGKLQQIYGYLHRNCRQKKTEPFCQDNEVVEQILRYIRKNFKQKINLDKICTDIGYSKFYACHAFKKRMGQSIIGYTNQLRCEYAERLLKGGTISLSAAGIRAGFSGTEQFLKHYEKLYGKSPDTRGLQTTGKG